MIKHSSHVSPDILTALNLASEIILHPNVLPTYNAVRIIESNASSSISLEKVGVTTPSSWQKGISKAFQNEEFSNLVERIISNGQKEFFEISPQFALMSVCDNKIDDNDPALIAYTNMHKYLCKNPLSSRWMALVMFAFSRMIAVNTSNGYQSNQWSELTVNWFHIEKSFLEGNGNSFSEILMRVDKENFNGRIADLCASRLSHAMAEMVLNCGDTTYFNKAN